jgi:metallo-beta-lactamase class B
MLTTKRLSPDMRRPRHVIARGWSQLAVLALFATHPLMAQTAQPADTARDATAAIACPSCAAWNAPQRPLRIYGNTYYVGTNGLSAVLITSPDGHILIDGGLAESAAPIIEHVRSLGFRVEDVKLILNSHAHYDHAGGIAALQRASGATVAASAWSAAVIERGTSGADDPQYGVLLAYPAASHVRVIRDGEVLRVGSLALTAHFTPGHTPGGTSWSWQACEQDRCLDLVYADSQTPVSADGFRFTTSSAYPSVLADFARGFSALEHMRCDILITPHPTASGLWERVASRDAGNASALIDPEACRRYAGVARGALAKRVASETRP